MKIHQHKRAYTQREGFSIDYGREVENEIVKLQEEISRHAHIESQYPSRWLAIKLLEGDSDIKIRLKVLEGGTDILSAAEKSIAHLEEVYGDDVDVVIADHRYGWINGLVRETVKRTNPDRLTSSDKVDRIVTHRLLGIPIFLLAMWIVFKLTADVSAPFLDWVDGVIGGPITHWIVALLRVLWFGGSWGGGLLLGGLAAGGGGGVGFVPGVLFPSLALPLF